MLKGILSISGKPGLYKMVTQGKSNIIVESLLDGKRIPAHSFSKIISLEDIAIYTDTEEVSLVKVFEAIVEKQGEGNEAPNPKKISSDELKAFFESILPDYDRDRVYTSDMKKVLVWFNLLLQNDLLDFKAEEESLEEQETEGNVDADVKE